MSLIFAHRMRSGVKLVAVAFPIALGLIAVRAAAELGLRLGDALFQVVHQRRAVAPDARVVFEAVAGVTAFAVSCVAVGWLWYRLILFWRQMRTSPASRPVPAVVRSQ